MDSSQTAHERCAQIAWLPSLQRKRDGSRSRVRQVTRQEMTLQQRKRKTSGQEQGEKARRDVLDQVSCARDLTGLVTVLHIMVERASVLTNLERDTRTLHRFDRLTWKATSTRITCAGAFAVSVPSLQNFASFDLDGKFILDSGATMSTGGVDLLQRIQEMYASAGLRLSSHPVSPLRFSFANGRENVSTSVFCLYRICLGKSYFTFEC